MKKSFSSSTNAGSTATSSLFQKYCEKIIGKLTAKEIEQFRGATRADDRIRLMYECAKEIPINSIESGKNYDLANHAKLKGNEMFAARKYDEALALYNQGIIVTPQNTDEGKELLSILISNRSATYFEQQEYRKVFDDIDYILAVGGYPQHLQYKIWLRKARCYDAIQNEKYADETYNLAIASLKHAAFDDATLAKKTEEIEQHRNNKKKNNNSSVIKGNEMTPISNSDLFVGGNQEFIAAHKSIYFDYDPLLGRHARACENIETGVVIIEENAHCAVVAPNKTFSNCQNCCVSTRHPVACPRCASVIFCSSACERQANAGYHRTECGIQQILFHAGASINCLMALRIVAQKPLAFFLQKRKQLSNFLKDSHKKMPIKLPLYRSDDYTTVFFLCRNEQMRNKGDLAHYAAMSIYLLRLLKYSGYFGADAEDYVLTDDEVFVGSLILRHLEILQFNSHEISELTNSSGAAETVDGIETLYTSECIGAGLYPTLALFNHSCDPSIVRYNIGNKMVVRTIKPIKAGDIVYENYGPVYTTMPVDKRRAILQERYWFECYCKPCQDDWSLFEDMNPNQIRFGCQTPNCPFEFVLYKDDFVPYMQCDYCNSMIKIFPCLKGLTKLSVLLPNAEKLFNAGQNREANKMFMESLDILYKYSRPPCPDMVKVQQRLRTLLLHLGNRHIDYVEK